MSDIHEPEWTKKNNKCNNKKIRVRVKEVIEIVVLLTLVLAIFNTLAIRRVTKTQQTHNRLFDSFQGLQQQMLKELRFLEFKTYKQEEDNVTDHIIEHINRGAIDEWDNDSRKSRSKVVTT